MEGWILIHRKICDHPFYKERRVFSRSEAWFDLIILANHEDHKFLLGTEVVEAKRGEVITSEVKLSERWRWSRTKVRKYLSFLEREQMVIKKSYSKKTVLFLLNYDPYQKPETGKKTAEKQQKNSRKTQSINYKELSKNYKEEPPCSPPQGGGPFQDEDQYEPEDRIFDKLSLKEKASYFVDTWNRICGNKEVGLQKVTMTPQVIDIVRAALKNWRGLIYRWEEYILSRFSCEDSFFRRDNPQWRKATFELVLSGDNVFKILRNEYPDPDGTVPPPGDGNQRRDPEGPATPESQSEAEEIFF